MPVYKFKVALEDPEDVTRDIEIKPTQTFLDFHMAIQTAVGFDPAKPASFSLCTDNWRKEREIAQNSFKDKKLVDFIDNPHQKFIYEADPSWVFLIELFKILPDDKNAQYPRCVKSVGPAPSQYKQSNIAVADADDEGDEEEIDDSGFYHHSEEMGVGENETEDMETEEAGDEDFDFEGKEGDDAAEGEEGFTYGADSEEEF